MSENPNQDTYHSLEDILAAEPKDETQPLLPRIKFPSASDSEALFMLEKIISRTLHKELGNKEYNQWLNESNQVIYKAYMRIYGVKEKNNKLPVKKKQMSKHDAETQIEEENSKKANPFRQSGRKRVYA